MKKFFAAFLVFVMLAALCACAPAEGESSSLPESSSEPEKSSEAEESTSVPESSESSSSQKTGRVFDFELPDLSKYSTERIPLQEDEDWCITGSSWLSQYEFKQYLNDCEEAYEMAAAAVLAVQDRSFNGEYKDFKSFTDIKDADSGELLWAAILETPTIPLRCSYSGDNHATVDEKYADTAVAQAVLIAGNEYGVAMTELYYVEDVEKTFRYIFGEEADFVPQNIESQWIRYVPEARIFVSDVERVGMVVYPQILSYTYENGRYYAKAALTYISLEYLMGFKDEPEFFIMHPYPDDPQKMQDIIINEETVDILWSEQIYDYIFERAEDGHLNIVGISC